MDKSGKRKMWFGIVMVVSTLSLAAIPNLSKFQEVGIISFVIPLLGAWFCYNAIFEIETRLLLIGIDLGNRDNEFMPIYRVGVFAFGSFLLLAPILWLFRETL